MKKLAVSLYLLSCLAPAAARAAGDCDLSISAPNVNIVWSQNFTFQAVTFTVTKAKNRSCNYGVAFTYGGASGYNSRRMFGAGLNYLNYQLYKDPSLTLVLKDIQDATSINDGIYGSFGTGSNQTHTLTYYVQIPVSLATTPTYRPSGTYTNTFNLRLFENPDSQSDLPVDTDSVTLATTMPKIIDLSVGPTGAAFDAGRTTHNLDFGALTEGESLGMSLMVRTNAGYSISFSSQNNGALRHVNAGVSGKVPYSVTVGGTPRNLSSSATSPVVVMSGSGRTSTSGVSSPVAVTVGSVEGRVAGQYVDNITVTAATTE